MTFLDATILGLLQGVTEFLPVSSSGHLALARDALDYAPPGGVLVEVLMHVGTALAIVVVFAIKRCTEISTWRSWCGSRESG